MNKNRKYEHLSNEMSERIRYDKEHGTRPNFAADGSKALRRDMASDRESAWRPAYLRDADKILHSPPAWNCDNTRECHLPGEFIRDAEIRVFTGDEHGDIPCLANTKILGLQTEAGVHHKSHCLHTHFSA